MNRSLVSCFATISLLTRFQTVVPISVKTQIEFIAAVKSNTEITLDSHITLTSTIIISGITGLIIYGDGRTVDADEKISCFYITASSSVSFFDLEIREGRSVSYIFTAIIQSAERHLYLNVMLSGGPGLRWWINRCGLVGCDHDVMLDKEEYCFK